VAANTQATLSYDLLGFGARQSSVTVRDVRLIGPAPVITGISGTTTLNERDTANLSVQFDGSLVESFSATVDWGDGTTDTVTIPVGRAGPAARWGRGNVA
jgi:hypothetical protein